ncbi:hypothetical protein ACFT5B_11225 [Luteimicrobium sp. NPDC057192]|uniref:hypothetical protein n=1 Tax=Luteimicrobium sp. NPDC057192 TaxID=3346042 RepID=UPI00363004C0
MLDLPHPGAAPRPVTVLPPPALPFAPDRRFRRVGARAVVPVLVLASAVLGITSESSTLRLDELTISYALGSLVTGAVIVGLLGVVATGRGTLLLTLLCVGASAAPVGALGAASLGCSVAALVVALALTVVAARDRARVRAATAGLPVLDVPTTATSLRELRRLGPVVLGLTALGLAAAAFGGWLWQHDARTVDAFRARAVVVPGTVLTVDDDDYSSRVRLSDGTTIRVPINDGSPRRGQHVEVRYDATSGRAELTDDVFDPTGAAALLGIGLGTVGWALGVGLTRRRGRLRALNGAGLAVTVDTRTSTSVRLLVGGVLVADADGLVPADLVEPEASGGPIRSDSDAASGDGPPGAAVSPPAELGARGTGPAALDELDELDDDEDDLAGLADDELLRRLRLWGVPEGPVLPGDEDERVPRGSGLAVGLGADGAGVAIRDVSGRWWLARSTRAPRHVRSVEVGAHRRTVPTATDGALGAEVAPADSAPATTAVVVRDDTTPDAADRALQGRTAWERFWGRVDQRTGHALVPLLRSTAAWLPWLVGPAVGVLVWWLQSADGIDWWGAVVGTWVVASAGHAWAVLGEPAVRWNARGIGVASVVARHRVAWTWVRSIIADDDHLVVRLRLPDGRDDVIVVPRRAPRFLVDHATEPREARKVLETARLRALTGQVDDRWVAPVTRTAVMTAWWLASAVAGLVLAAVG